MLDYEVAGDFSMAEDDISNFNPDSGELILGDIVISYDKVIEQAAEYNHSRKRELAFLVAHSMLLYLDLIIWLMMKESKWKKSRTLF